MLPHEAKRLASHLQGGPRLSPNSTPWQAEEGVKKDDKMNIVFMHSLTSHAKDW